MNDKKYRAIFFDWDGTAVTSRKASAEKVTGLMKRLLERDVLLIIISGTCYENIAGGRLHEMLPPDCLDNLYLGLDRGARNYRFKKGRPAVFHENMPSGEDKLKIDRAAFALHEQLYRCYSYQTDIVFSRANYCKIDMQVELDRSDKLYFEAGELKQVEQLLCRHQFSGGLAGVLSLAEELGRAQGFDAKATTDAKYIELGTTTKSDNVDVILDEVVLPRGIAVSDCAFFGDEFTYMAPGIAGSDAFMITDKSRKADFFDVSIEPILLPEGVTALGGSVEMFAAFLKAQAQ